MPKIDPNEIFPLTIVGDRYYGSYSGAQFLAFNKEPSGIPSEIGGGDSEEMNFWWGENSEIHDMIIGKGNTIYQAIKDLYLKINT